MTAVTDRVEANVVDVVFVRARALELGRQALAKCNLAGAMWAAQTVRLLDAVRDHAPHVAGEVAALVAHDITTLLGEADVAAVLEQLAARA